MSNRKISTANYKLICEFFDITPREALWIARYLDMDLRKPVPKPSEFSAMVSIIGYARRKEKLEDVGIVPSMRIGQIIHYLNQHGRLPRRRWIRRYTQVEYPQE